MLKAQVRYRWNRILDESLEFVPWLGGLGGMVSVEVSLEWEWSINRRKGFHYFCHHFCNISITEEALKPF